MRSAKILSPCYPETNIDVLQMFLDTGATLAPNIGMVNPTKRIDPRLRQSLRLSQEVCNAIDEARKNRAGNVSRNTWISEAILEKLQREKLGNDNEIRRSISNA